MPNSSGVGAYASGTSVSSEASRIEIERTLRRFGASAFLYGTSPNLALIAFEYGERRYRFTLPLPDRNGRDIVYTPARGTVRSERAQEEAYEQAVRERWRALLLVIKAMLVAVETGIMTLEAALLAQMVLPDNVTVGERMLPQLAQIAVTGELPALLPAPAASPARLRMRMGSDGDDDS